MFKPFKKNYKFVAVHTSKSKPFVLDNFICQYPISFEQKLKKRL